MPIPTQPPMLLGVIGGDADVLPIKASTTTGTGELSYQSGWPAITALPLEAGGVAPQREYFNAVNKLLSQHIFFLQSGGVYPWSDGLNYLAGAHVLGSNSHEFVALQQSGPDTGTGPKNPTNAANSDYWRDITAALSAGYVTLDGAQTISGLKTFSSGQIRVQSSDNTPRITAYMNNVEKGSPPSSTTSGRLDFCDKTGSAFGSVVTTYAANGDVVTSLRSYSGAAGGDTGSTSLNVRYYGSSAANPRISTQWLCPEGDNTYALGTASVRWSMVYAATGAIQTSDERVKTQIDDIPEAVLRAWGEVRFQQFKLRDSVAAKGGDAARLHIGVIAQRVVEAFAAEGLDAREYGLLCHDQWEAEPEIVDDDGVVVAHGVEAGDRYSVRYDECLALECAYQRWRLEQLEERLLLLEA